MRETNIQSIEKRVYELERNGGGGGSSADKVSYDNLTSGLVADNVQNAIDEVHEEIENYKHHYSTEEKVVGEWVDGSLIYEKSIVFTGNYSKNTTHSLGNDIIPTLNIKNIISFDGSLQALNSHSLPLNIRLETGGAYTYIGTDTVEMKADFWDISNVIITVTYTKNE